MVVLNYTPDEILDRKHICYYTEPGNDQREIRVYEVVELTLDHPEAKGIATLLTTVSDLVYEGSRKDIPTGVLLEASQKALRDFHKDNPNVFD